MIFSHKNINKLKNKLKGKKVVLVGGCFDLLHEAHIDFLKEAKNYGEELVVMIQSDKYIALNKGKGRPIYSQNSRAKILNSIKYVSHVILIPESLAKEKLPLKILLDFKPSVFATKRKGWRKFSKEIKKVGTKIVFLKRSKLNSSSKIIRKIQKNK